MRFVLAAAACSLFTTFITVEANHTDETGVLTTAIPSTHTHTQITEKFASPTGLLRARSLVCYD